MCNKNKLSSLIYFHRTLAYYYYLRIVKYDVDLHWALYFNGVLIKYRFAQLYFRGSKWV